MKSSWPPIPPLESYTIMPDTFILVWHIPQHVPTLLYLGLAWHPPSEMWDVPLWAAIVRHAEGSLSQLIRVEPSPKLPTKLDPKIVLSPPTSSHPWQPAQLAQPAPTPSGHVGTQGRRLGRCGDLLFAPHQYFVVAGLNRSTSNSSRLDSSSARNLYIYIYTRKGSARPSVKGDGG